MWKIINTTDRKYLGMIVSEPSDGDKIEFLDGFTFFVNDKVIQNNKMTLSCPNYIIILILTTD